MSDQDQPQGSSGARTFLSCLGIGCGVVLVLALVASIAGYFLKDKIRDAAADGMYGAFEQDIQKSSIDQAEKDEVLVELARLRDGIKGDEVSMAEIGSFMQDAITSPLQGMLVTRGGMDYINKDPAFTTEERTVAAQLMNRYMRGRMEGEFVAKDDRDLARTYGEVNSEGVLEIKEDPSTEQLRALISLTEKKVDEAEIPEGDYQADISQVIRDLIDPILE